MTNPTHYHNETPDEVKAALETLMQNKHRARFFFGSTVSGTAWMEEYHVIGTVSRSTGYKPVPLIIHNARSIGGPAILDRCIVKIIDINTRRTLYEHPHFNNPADNNPEIHENHDHPSRHPYQVTFGRTSQYKGEYAAGFMTRRSAENYIKFMQGKRFTK